MGELSYLAGSIGIMTVATVATRALPFLLLRGREHNPVLEYLGLNLPPAVMTILVLFAVREVQVLTPPHGVPEAAALGVTVVLQLWRRNALLSIAAGTGLYMYLEQTGALL